MAESEGAVDEAALRGQLACLQDQARQLGSLVGDDPQSPLLPLQRELEVAIDGIRQRLSSWQEQGDGQAADATTTATISSSSLAQEEDDREEQKCPESHGDDDGDDDDGGGDGRGGGSHESDGTDKQTPPHRPPAAKKSRRFAAGDPCLAPRVFDRRRARAVVEEVLPGCSGVCLVTWLHPRERGELVCRYWKEGRSCKFSGPDCPFSHGVEVSVSDLLPDDDSRDWEARSPATAPASAAVAEDGVSTAAAAWLLKDRQEDRDDDEGGGNAKAATDASKGSSSSSPGGGGGGGGGSSSSRGGSTAKMCAGGAWLAGLRSGSRVLARYRDRVWYEATAEGPVAAGKQLPVRFRGFEDDGPVSIPANSAHLAPLEVEGGRGGRRRRSGRGEGPPGASSDSEDGEEKGSDLEDAWADAGGARGDGDGDGDAFSAERFFQERVLGDRRDMTGGGGGGGGGGGSSGGAGGGGGDGREGGLCSDAYVFGGWEQHTKGFGSRMMNRMGYRRGEGLGKEKQGICRPVPIRVLPERRALDHLRVDDGGASQRAASSSGGTGKTKKKSNAGGSSIHRQGGGGGLGGGDDGGGVFNFLNKTMHASAQKGKAAAAAAGRSSGRLLLAERRAGASVSGAAGSFSSSATTGAADPARKPAVFPEKTKRGEGSGGRAVAASGMSQLELRSHLVQAREAEAALAAKIGRLQEAIERNSERDPRTAAQARKKLEEIRLQAKEVRASRDRAERALGNRGLDGGGGGGSGGGSKGGRKGRGKGGLFSF